MKLKNKKTGEIIEVESLDVDSPTEGIVGIPSFDRKGSYNSLAELNAEWKDYEEPETFWYMTAWGDVKEYSQDQFAIKQKIAIGNYFESKEEAEKAVEKLKALTKLCKKGFEFNSVEMFGSGLIRIEASIPINEKTTLQERSNITDSLYLLFGGEE